MISQLLVLSTMLSNPICKGTLHEQCFFHLLLNAGQSERLCGGAGCGHLLFTHQELQACQMCIFYLAVYVDCLVFGEAHLW